MMLRRFHAIDGARVALIDEPGRIYTKMVYIDSPMRVHKVPNGDVASFSYEILHGARNIKPTARAMLKAGKRLGITGGAKKFLRRVL